MSTQLGKNLKRMALGGAMLAAATTAYAANQGSTAFNSIGDLDIDLVVANEVKISNLDDISLNFSGSDVSGSSIACVYRNGLTGDYEITATGDGTAGAYTLTDGTNSVGYSVIVDDGAAGNDTATLSAGTAVSRANASNVNDDCSTDGDNVTITVGVSAVDAASLPAATYSGTLTLLVAPN